MACGDSTPQVQGAEPKAAGITVTRVAKLDHPWAMTFLPDGRLLVTEKTGQLRLVTQEGDVSEPIKGIPEVAYGGQGGLGDVVLAPDFEQSGLIYISYAEAGSGNTRGAVVARGRLSLKGDDSEISDLTIIWKQHPKVTGRGHYGHRMVFSDEGYLFISSGERQKFTPSQDMDSNMGKILRLYPDGTLPKDNPFAEQGAIAAQVWSLGHRNPLGLAFDGQGRLWNHEMGPAGGDELNLVIKGNNYGYPTVSNGDHYSGKDIPDHDTRPEFAEPAIWWTPVISPGGLVFYSGNEFPDWQGNALIAGLSARALVRVAVDDSGAATEVERIDMGKRIREVEQGPAGDVWLLEDGRGGRLLRLTASP
ncbi:MAG: PQQ-dependent sugar dehydrogenase [Pseudomonadota bacterium]